MRRLKWFAVVGLVLTWLAACAPPPQQESHNHKHDHGEAPATASKGEPPAITIDQLRKQMEQGMVIIFIDTRNEMAWQTSETQIPGSIRISNNRQLATMIKDLPKDSFIVSYCT